ncbi:ABC transporter substrate-binding protein [Pseudonocardia sp. CA-142604]|uniref:ABC transporter substrate-binding protein n=1 Tax=Pseudonocardia sp. CA-142604 TaxID=3240024 RepID=UPI003D8F9311
MTQHDLVPATASARFRSPGRLTRRGFLAAGALSATAFLAACGGSASAPPSGRSSEIDIYSWADYFAQENLSAFTAATGITPKISTYADNDTLAAKLGSAPATGFDLVIPTSGWIPFYASRGQIEKIDTSRVDLSTLDPSLLSHNYDPHNQYSIPKDWGVLGVTYDPRAVGGNISTWQDFLDAGERPSVQGKVRLSSSGWENVGVVMWTQGQDWNTTDQSVIRAAGDRLKDWATRAKPQLGGTEVDPLVNGSIVMSLYDQSQARRAIMQNPALRWVVPAPTSELWVDCYAIPRGAPHTNAAYAFLKHQLTEQAQVIDTQSLGYPAALAGLQQKLPPGTDHADLIFGGPGLDLSRLTSFVVNPDTVTVYQEIETELRAAS